MGIKQILEYITLQVLSNPPDTRHCLNNPTDEISESWQLFSLNNSLPVDSAQTDSEPNLNKRRGEKLMN